MWAKINLIFTIMKGGIDMVIVYVALSVAGRKTYAQVPATLKDAVKAELEKRGLGNLAV